MRKRLSSLGLAVAMAAPLTTCGSSETAETTTAAPATEPDAAGGTTAAGETAETTEAAGDVIKTGGIGPATGGAAVYGLAIQRDAQLVTDGISAAGGINGVQVKFKLEDDEHGAKKPVSACNTLEDWGTQTFMGTVTSIPCVTVADKTVPGNMFQIIPSGSAVECTANPNVFRVCFSDPDQGAASIEYIGENKLAPKIAVIYDNSDVYSSGIHEKFVEESKSQSLGVVAAKTFTADSNKDFPTQLQKARGAGAELISLSIYYTKASLILQQADKIGFIPQFFRCDGMDDILQVQNFDTKLTEGPMLLTPSTADASDDLTINFVKSYEDACNEVPVQFAANVYDAIYAIKVAMKDTGVTSDMDASIICDALKTPMLNIKLDRLTGKGMTWTEDGESHKAPKAVKVVDRVCTAM